MKKSAIIFGSSGQDGYYLNKLLLRNNIKTINISRKSGDVIGDVSDFKFVENVIKKYTPNFIFHFAAVSSTKHEFLFENNLAISTGTINILESIKNNNRSCKVFLSGSAMQFRNDGKPINESTPFHANSPYSVSRIHSVYLARYFREKFGLKTYIGYLFNHDSPFRSSKHINQRIVEFVVNISNGNNGKLIIGDLNAKKEFNHAEDIIEAIWILVNQNNIFEAVIGSGLCYSIQEWIEYCFETYNLNWNNYVEIDSNYEKQYNSLVSSPKLIKSLGWEPKNNMSSLADLMLKSIKKNDVKK